MDTVNDVREEHHERLTQCYETVIGSGCGHKLVNGVDTGKPAIIIFVTEKIRPIHGLFSSLPPTQLLPPEIDGIPTDVIEVGHITKQLLTARVRPILPGYSVSHYKVTAGTLGGIFQDINNNIVILSCNHVLANENACHIGDYIFQPGIADNPTVNRNFVGWTDNVPYFATLRDYAVLSTTQNNLQDSAVAMVYSDYIARQMVNPNYPNGLPMAGIGAPSIGLVVQKFGRTTGQTMGKILAMNSTFTIGYDIGPTTFTGTIVTSSMSKGGDSGAITLDDKMNAIGLLFAGSDKVSLHTPMAPIINRYGLRIWKPWWIKN